MHESTYLLNLATRLRAQEFQALGSQRRKLEIARRHVLAAARILTDDQRVYDVITELLERPMKSEGE